MREILFHGKRIDNDEWVEGCLAAYDLICPNYPEDTSNAMGDYYGQTPYVGFVEVDSETIGQFTGMTDKNGKRIFEGDIIKRFWIGAEIIYWVQYGGESARFIGKAINKRGFTTFDNDGEIFEVIGNIHDNPELLEDANA